MNVNKLKAAIVESGYTQVSLAKELGVSKNTINAKINGKSRLFVDEACAICELLNISDDKQKASIFLSGSSQFRDNSEKQNTVCES